MTIDKSTNTHDWPNGHTCALALEDSSRDGPAHDQACRLSSEEDATAKNGGLETRACISHKGSSVVVDCDRIGERSFRGLDILE